MQTVDHAHITAVLEIADLDGDEASIRTQYGWGYGRTCFGIVTEDFRQAARFLAALGAFGMQQEEAEEDEIIDWMGLAGDANWNSMGLGMIVYFPGWQLSNVPDAG